MKPSTALLTTSLALTNFVNSQSTSSSSLTSSYSPLASCSSTLTAGYAAPSVAPGFVARLVARNLTSPRGIKFDNNGALLVVEQDKGITALTLVESGAGCWSVSSRKTVIDDPSLNHGIELSPDGLTLYASSGSTLYSWSYSSLSQTNTSAPRALVTGMTGSDHTSRTLLLSKKSPGKILINRGSNSNIDLEANDITTGHSQIKAFDLTKLTSTSPPYDFVSDGLLLGWGLRNDVGIDEHPLTGGVYSVENSADQILRNDVDIHSDNPAEELNFLGYLNGTASSNQGRNFGYPNCFTAWNSSVIPIFNGTVGGQFAIDPQPSSTSPSPSPSSTAAAVAAPNDALCSSSLIQPPRLAFAAHTAPLDLLFNPSGSSGWITFHGSWNRENPVGYKLSAVAFDNGEPVKRLEESHDALRDVLSNEDVGICAGERAACFRPVGLAWDSKGGLWMSSDATGEIYVVLRSDGGAVKDFDVGSLASSGPSSGSGGTSGSSGSGGSSTGSAPGEASTNLATASSLVLGMSLGLEGKGVVSAVLAVGFGVLAFLL